MKVFTRIVLRAKGVVFTDLNAIIEAISLQYVPTCVGVVLPAVAGGRFAGRLAGFNFNGFAITDSYGTANLGGAGDVAVF